MNKLQTFVYQGWNAQGEKVSAQIQSSHILLARNELRLQGIWVKSLRKQWQWTQRIAPAQLHLITQQLAVLVRACLPLTFCLNLLAKQCKPPLSVMFAQMMRAIENGDSFSTALQRHPQLFPSYFTHLIQVGEASGQLAEVLTQLANYQETRLTQIQQLKKVLLYPMSVLGLSLLITAGLLLFIVPQFQVLFAQMDLPYMTQMVFALSDFLQELSGLELLIATLWVFGCIYLVKRSVYCQQLLAVFLRHLPLIGQLLHDQQQARYLRSLGMALQAGLPLLQALQLSTEVVQQTYFAQKTRLILPAVQSGMNLQQAFTQSAQFSEFVIQLITIGEQTSQLHRLLLQSTQVLEQRIEQLMQTILQLLQPLVMTLLGLLLGGLMIALYLPVFKLGALY